MDLASRTSLYFGEIDASRGKGHDCPICHKDLQFETEDVTFCRKEQCGVNFHLQCISQYRQRFSQEHPSTPVKCPKCRKIWITAPKIKLSFSGVEERSFDIYSEWLYRHSLEIETKEEAGTLFEELIKAYAFGLRIEDVDFCEFIMEVIIEQMQDGGAQINANHVAMAYKLTSRTCTLRELLVRIYKALGPEVDVSDDFWGTLPSLFLRDLFAAFTEDSQKPETRSWKSLRPVPRFSYALSLLAWIHRVTVTRVRAALSRKR